MRRRCAEVRQGRQPRERVCACAAWEAERKRRHIRRRLGGGQTNVLPFRPLRRVGLEVDGAFWPLRQERVACLFVKGRQARLLKGEVAQHVRAGAQLALELMERGRRAVHVHRHVLRRVVVLRLLSDPVGQIACTPRPYVGEHGAARPERLGAVLEQARKLDGRTLARLGHHDDLVKRGHCAAPRDASTLLPLRLL